MHTYRKTLEEEAHRLALEVSSLRNEVTSLDRARHAADAALAHERAAVYACTYVYAYAHSFVCAIGQATLL